MNHYRTVKSFVRRMGRMSDSAKNSLKEHGESFCLSHELECFDPIKCFRNDNPVVLEIGFGMGRSFLSMAKNNTDINFVGIEVHLPGIAYVMQEGAALGLQNIKLYAEDAVLVLNNAFPQNSLDKIQIFFPDPWPKKRHHKRRLIQSAFIEQLRLILKPDGVIHIATDWEDYARHIQSVLDKSEGLTITDVSSYNRRFIERLETKYELRGQRLGHRIFDFYYQKNS